MDSLIRALEPDDIGILAQWIPSISLWQRYGVTETGIRSQLEKAYTQGDLLLVADWGESERACGLAWILPKGAFGRSPYLKLLGTRLAGQGIGAALLNHTEQAVSIFTNELFLLVSDFNLDGQRFYQREGYRQVGALAGYVLPDVTELVLWKKLHV